MLLASSSARYDPDNSSPQSAAERRKWVQHETAGWLKRGQIGITRVSNRLAQPQSCSLLLFRFVSFSFCFCHAPTPGSSTRCSRLLHVGRYTYICVHIAYMEYTRVKTQVESCRSCANQFNSVSRSVPPGGTSMTGANGDRGGRHEPGTSAISILDFPRRLG